MAGEIQVAHAAAGKPLYALVRNATGGVWQPTTGTFVAYATAGLADYTIALAEQGTASRYYAGPFPAAAAGRYGVAVYERTSPSPAEGDPLVAAGVLEWDGAAVVPLATRATPAGVWTSPARTLTAFGFNVTVATNNDKTGYQLDLAQPLPGTPAGGSTGEALKFADTRLDAAVSTRLAAAGYVAPDNAGVGAVKAQTDRLTFDGSNNLHARTRVNDDKAGYGATVTALTAGVISAAAFAPNAIDASALAADAAQEIADALLDRVDGVEPGFTPRQALRLILSALAAKLAGGGGPVVAIRDVNDTRTRITATVDAHGNRTTVSLDPG